jgi:uncharacterized repeat protein (TIGR03803 family)
MYRRTNTTPALALAVQAVLAVTLIATAAGQTPTYSVVYRFDPTIESSLPIIEGPEGGIYGATRGEGGTETCSGYACGLVYKLDPGTGELTILHLFDGTDGTTPYAGKLVRNKAGYLYGETILGGPSGDGVVFGLDPSGSETILYGFPPSDHKNNGNGPEGGLIGDSDGNLYGVTESGGSGCFGEGCGLVFRIGPTGSYTVLYRFKGGPSDGESPAGPLIRDNAGNLFGVAGGGTSGCGTIFKLTPTGTETVLYNFPNCSAGSGYGLVEDAAGNLYGATGLGGASGLGSVYKLDTSGVFTELYSFTGDADGGEPSGPLFLDATGNLFGTAQVGGLQDCSSHSGGGCGVVFEVSPSGVETVVHSFTGNGQGSYPGPGLLGRPASGGGLEFLEVLPVAAVWRAAGLGTAAGSFIA